tara:strand:+ start:895 stop:1515 length:621 start_codon:yes stop_codon:yes gene_type:complete
MSYKSNKKGCSFCKEQGHHIKHCPILANNECGNCHKLGHTTRHCRNNKHSYNKPRRIIQSENNGWNTVTKKKVKKFTPSYIRYDIKCNRFGNQGKNETKKAIQRPTHISYNRFNGVECELVIERTPPNGAPTYKDIIIKESGPKVKESGPKIKETGPKVKETGSTKLPILKSTNPKKISWADMCDEDDELNRPEEIERDLIAVFAY